MKIRTIQSSKNDIALIKSVWKYEPEKGQAE
jgi:hypothetical protein